MSSHEWRQNPVTLTDRERTILELIAGGFSNEEIAAGLALSRNTVKWYIQLIYQKLGVSRRTQAVGQARTLGLLGGLTVSDSPSRSHLPTPAAPLIGRETDLAALSELLNRADVRLLSIVGPSGMGKTRLALAVAAEWQRQSGRVHFVSLEEVSTEEELIATVAEALGVHLQGQTDLRTSLLMNLRSLSLLLVLDNFDDLLEAAPLVARWLGASPYVKVLITSCEPLDLSGEHIYAVHGLSHVAVPDDHGPSGAVQLFLECACQMQYDYTPGPAELAAISQICHLVEGMPLAIEIAAAWVCTISLEQIHGAIKNNLESLQTPRRDAPLRHHSIRAILDYTWSHLAEDERVALSRLAIFRNGFHDRAALSVATVPLHLLYSLVHRLLLYRIGRRYRMHGLVRLYAEEKLRLDGAAHRALIRARRDYYAALLQEIAPQLKSAGQMEALATIAEEFHDIEAVWATALADQDWTTCGSCLDSLYLYHEIKGPFQRGRDFFEELIRRLESAPSRDASEQVILGKALAYSGRLATQLGLHQQGAEQLQRSLAILDGTEAGADRAFALKNLGYNAYLVGDYERAASLVGESLTMRRALAEPWDIADSLNSVGVVAEAQGKLDQAWDLYTEALDIRASIGDRRGIALSYNNLGDLARTQGKYQQAATYLQRSYDLFENLGDRWGMSLALNNLGDVAFQQADYEQAYSLIGRSLSLRREIGEARGITFCLHGLGNLALAQGDHLAARRWLSEAFTMAVRVGLTGHEIAVVAEHLADALEAGGDESPLVPLLRSIAAGPSEATAAAIGQVLRHLPEFGSLDDTA